MFTLALSMILVVLLVPYPVNAQQAEAPVYKDGDWWRVKVDLSRPAGVSVAPGLEQFPEYIVKFERVSRLCSASEGANLNKSPEHWSLRWFLAGVNFVAICYDFRCVWASLGRDELISNRQACKCVRQKPNTRFKRGKR
jgi:hypothetical protein